MLGRVKLKPYRFWTTVFIIFLLDQFSKFVSVYYLADGGGFGRSFIRYFSYFPWSGHQFTYRPVNTIEVIPDFFFLSFVTNKGVVWGLFPKYLHYITPLSILLVLLLLFIYYRFGTVSRFLQIGLALQVGGALGNITDRIRLGRVVDFLDFRFHFGSWSYNFPVFNIADSSAVVGTIIVALFLLFYDFVHRRLPKTEIPEPAEAGKPAYLLIPDVNPTSTKSPLSNPAPNADLSPVYEGQGDSLKPELRESAEHEPPSTADQTIPEPKSSAEEGDKT